MKKTIVLIMIVIAALLVMTSSVFAYSGVTNILESTETDYLVSRDRITVKDDAYYDETENSYVLTEEKHWQCGSLWFDQVRCNSSFRIAMDYYTGDNEIHSDGRPGGDGICVAFYSDADKAGEKGKGLGYDGHGGYGIELDTFSNEYDPEYYHVAIVKDSVSNHLAYADISTFVKDEKWHHLTIENHGGTCTVSIDGRQVLEYDGIYSDGHYSIGITSATGAGYNLHKVKNVELIEAVWEDASDWADKELFRTEELDLIPDILIGTNLRERISRKEFAAVAIKVYENLSGTLAIPSVTDPFTDTKDLDVLKAYNLGIVNGYGGGIFGPDDDLNREQCATMLTRVFKKVTIPGWSLESDSQFNLVYTKPAPFVDDSLISSWAKDSVYFMVTNNIIKGMGDNMFVPRNTTSKEEAEGYATATREQALVIAVRMVENLK